jgi:hypothetical protein
MQHAIVLGASMMITMSSFGFVASDSGYAEAVCFGPLCLLQPPPLPEMRRPNDRTKESHKRGPRGEVTQRMIDRIMEIAKEVDPELGARLGAMCQEDPEVFKSLIRRQGRGLGSLLQLREIDPDLFEVKLNELKLDAEILLVSNSIRELGTDEDVTQAQIATLRGLVRAKTALSIRVQTLSINRLERHIAALRQKIADTSDRFDEVVEERVEQLLSETKKPAKN